MRTTKKITSIVLAVLMVVSVMVVGTVAASAADVTVNTYEQFKEAVANYSAWDHIKLGADIEGTDQITFAGGTVYLDLNGHTLTNNAASPAKGDIVLNMSASYNTLYVTGPGTLQLNNWYYGFRGDQGGLNIGANVTVNSPEGNMLYTGNWTVNGTMTSDNWFTIGTNGSTSHDYGIIINEGAVVTSTGAAAIYHCQDGELNISGGTITGYESGVYIKAGTTEINGGTIKCTGPAADYRFNGNGTYETGDALVVDNCDYPAGTPAITITGGTFESANAKAIASYIKADDPSTGAAQQPRVEEFVKGADLKGAEAVDNDIFVAGTTVETVNGVTVVRSYICEDANTGIRYETVDAAVQAAGENGYIKLITDVNGQIAIHDRYTSTLDLNGHTVTRDGGYTINFYGAGYGAPVKTFTITDTSADQSGKVINTSSSNYAACVADSSYSNIKIEGGTFISPNKATWISSDDGWEIAGGTFNGNIFVRSDVDITGGTVNGKLVQDCLYDYSSYPYAEIPAEIEVSGGEFSQVVPEEFCAPGFVPVTTKNANGKYEVEVSPLNPIIQKDDDGNAFGLGCDYRKGALLGVQRKDAIDDAAYTSESRQETGNDMRFVAVISKDITSDPDVSDYGFVLARVDDTKSYANTDINKLRKGDDRAKTISAVGTTNTVCGNANYGDTSVDTPYNYVTCAVNGVTGSDKIVARFYVVKDGKTYYARYGKDNYVDGYTGAIAGMSDLV